MKTVISLLGLFLICLAQNGDARLRKIKTRVESVPSWLTSDIQGFLAKTKIADLPEKLQRLVREVGDNNHWCCAIDTVKTLVTSHAVIKYYQTSHHTKYYRGCGWWGWSRCSVRQTHYRHNAGYFTQYKSTTHQTTCPDRHSVCCRGYLLVAEHCLPLHQLAAIKDDLVKLKEMGLLAQVQKIGYSVGSKVKGVFLVYKGRYTFTYDQAVAACKNVGAKLATLSELNYAWLAGMDQCSCGWTTDGKAHYPITKSLNYGCGGHYPGVRTCSWQSTWDAYCSDNSYTIGKTTKGVFLVREGRYTFSYDQAVAACRNVGARLASFQELMAAWVNGMDDCVCGWIAERKAVYYPESTGRITGCAGSKPGIVRPCLWQSTWDAYCTVD